MVLALAMIFALIQGAGLGSLYEEYAPESEIYEGELYICECGGECENVFMEPEEYEPEYENETCICECENGCENISSGNENEGDNEGGEYESVSTEPEYATEPAEPEYEPETQPTEPEAPAAPVLINFGFDGDLILEMTELHSGADLTEIMMRGVTAVDADGNDVTHLIFVADDGGFGDYVSNYLSHILAGGGELDFGGWDPEPIDPGFGGFAGLNDELFGFELIDFNDNGSQDFAFRTEIIYALVHPESGEPVVSEPRELAVNFIGIIPLSQINFTGTTYDQLQMFINDNVPTTGALVTINIMNNISTGNLPVDITGGRNVRLISTQAGGRTLMHNGVQAGTGNRHFRVAMGSGQTGTLTLGNGITITSPTNMTFGGGGIDTSSGGIFRMEGGVISNNRATFGGAVNIGSYSTFYMTGGVIRDNTAGGGGAVQQGGTNSNFMMTSGTLQDNIATGAAGGGALYINSGPNYTTISGDARIVGNRTTGVNGGGGGIYVINGANVEISGNAVIEGNHAAGTNGTGGAVAFGGMLTTSTVTMSDNAIMRGNIANQSGGAVHMSGAVGVFNMEGGTIGGTTPAEANRANGIGANHGGGAVSLAGSNTPFTMSGTARIIGNIAANHGGAVRITNAGSTFTMTDRALGGTTVVERNTVGANGNGGAVWMSNGTFNMNGGSTILQHSAVSGGGVFMIGGTFHMRDTSVIAHNTATSLSNVGGGGGVWQQGGTFNMSGNTFIEHNRAIGTAGVANGGVGGGVAIAGTGTRNFRITGGTIRYNHAERGGGIFVANANGILTFANPPAGQSGTILVHGNETFGNTSLDTSNVGGGGGVHVYSGGRFNMYTGTISGNRARVMPGVRGGAGVHVSGTNSRFDMMGGLIGGASGANMFLPNPLLGSTAAYGIGAGVKVHGGGIFNMSGAAAITHNTTNNTSNGGGISNSGGTVAMSGNARVTDNRAGNAGGGVNQDGSGNFTMSGNARIEDNIINSTGAGGGGVNIVNGTFTMNGGQIINHTRTRVPGTDNPHANPPARGGGVRMTGGTLNLNSGAIISGNRSNVGGGGIWAEGNSTINMAASGTITNNRTNGVAAGNPLATTGGGGVAMIGNNSRFIATGGSVTHNRAYAGNGGGIYIMVDNDGINPPTPRLETSDTTVFMDNQAPTQEDFGMENGINTFPGISWADINSLGGIRTTATPAGPHLLNNYDIYATDIEPPEPPVEPMSIEISHDTIFFGTHGSNWLQRQRAPIQLGESGTGYSPSPGSLIITVENGLSLNNWHVQVSSAAMAGCSVLSQMLVAGTGGSIHGSAATVYAYTAAGTPAGTYTILWGNLSHNGSARDPRVDIQSNPLGPLVDGNLYSAVLTWTLVQGAPGS